MAIGKPSHDLLTLAYSSATDLKLIGMIDHRFDAQYESLFVVHLDPVGSHPVFDPCSSGTLLTIVEHLALEIAVKFSSEKGQDILGAETDRGVFQQFWIQLLQGGAIVEHNVRGEFVLIDYPVIFCPFQQVPHEGIDPGSHRIERAVEFLSGEVVGKALGSIHVFDPCKSIVDFLVGYAVAIHLAGEPIVTIDADLDVHGKPRLDTHMHHAPLTVNEIVVEAQTFALGSYKTRPPLAIGKHEALARLDNAKDTYESCRDTVLQGNLLSKVFFAVPVTIQILIRTLGTFGDSLCMVTQALRLLRDEFLEIFDQNTLTRHERLHASTVSDGQVSLENNSIRARQNASDLGSMLFNEFFQRLGLIRGFNIDYHDRAKPESSLVAAVPR